MENCFSPLAKDYEKNAILAREINQRLIERFAYIKHEPKMILDLGSATGFGAKLLAEKFPQANIICLDLSREMLQENKASRKIFFRRQHALCADALHLPLADQSFDLVYSNLLWQWIDEPDLLVAEAKRVLKDNGLFMFSALGTDSLKNCRKIDHQFPDIHDIGDQLMQAGFHQPVMDTEWLEYRYFSSEKSLRELRQQGFGYYLDTDKFLSLERNEINIVFEIIYGHAWKIPLPDLSVTNSAGEIIFDIKNISRSVDKKR